LHVLIKLLATITLVMAPLFIKSGSVKVTPSGAPGTTTTIESQIGSADATGSSATSLEVIAP
jgi:uncharacterized membrane protein YphA (DoxX/SURF4 family)